MKRILIAVITEGDQCVAPFCASLVQSVKAGFESNIEFSPIFVPSNGNWSMAFNQLATLAWEENLDGFVCINPNVSWPPKGLLELVGNGKDALALPVATRGGFDTQTGEISRLQDDGREIKVQATSLDFFYLSPYALDSLCQSHPFVKYRGNSVKLVLQSGDIYTDFFDPADILAYRLREQGIEVWLNYKHTAFRSETIEYTASFEQVLNNLKAQ
jgi:hypothetical protein